MANNPELDYRHRVRIGRILGILIVLAALVTGNLVWRINYRHPRTNDAIVRADIVGIAPEVSGRIVQLRVRDNQFVRKGELLYVIDPRPYQARLDRAKAELMLAEKSVESQKASKTAAVIAIERLGHQRVAALAEIKRIEADDDYLQHYLERLEPLAEKQYVTGDQLKQARARREASRAALADAKAKERSTESSVNEAVSESRRAQSLIGQFGNVNAHIEAAKASVTTAELDLEYCQVRAPFDAYVTNLNTREGEYARVGMELFALVDNSHWYAIANYKETYLQSIQPGHEAEVFLIGYPGKRFRGVVTGIGWATAPDNTKQQGVLPELQRTLNWVILASRFPVRIEILDRIPDHPLRMGMTAFVTILDNIVPIPSDSDDVSGSRSSHD